MGLCSLSSWKDKLFKTLCLSNEDWVGLMLTQLTLRGRSMFSTSESIRRIAEVLKTVIQSSVDSLAFFSFDILLEFCESSDEAYCDRLQVIMPHIEDCWFLVNNLNDSIVSQSGLTPSNLGMTEKTSMPYLYAWHETITVSRGGAVKTDLEPLRAKLLHRFTPIAMNRISIYLAYFYTEEWKKLLSNPAFFTLSADSIKQLKHPILRNGVIAFLVDSYLSPWLTKVTDVVERGRKAPRDALCLRLCGMSVESTIQVFDSWLNLLGDAVLVLEPGYVGVEDIRADFLEVLEMPALMPTEQFANGPISSLLAWVASYGANSYIDRDHVTDLQSLLKFLRAVFAFDIKMVRPSRLFSSRVYTRPTIMYETASSDFVDDELSGDVASERALFAAKLPNMGPESIWSK
ncbi:hypothetical protein HDU67_002983 [Dinochytrium kinnereticum]|nr:hypothetical protein HDU67_002983 [Dinochytrium kinnereticum]